MTAWVLDSSMALAWALPDEKSAEAERFMAQAAQDSRAALWVPALWWYEIANALTSARRRKRLSEADAARLIELYGQLPLQTDASLGGEAMWRHQALAVEHGLSAYDAAYLELAQRTGAGLASLDERLSAAARQAGLTSFA
ncbi:MAG: type II toxin-antitoxin system VapC family toxin [Elusimicrobiota bacterium]